MKFYFSIFKNIKTIEYSKYPSDLICIQKWLFLGSNPIDVTSRTTIKSKRITKDSFSHRYLIYGYTRPKVNNTNAFHNNRQNVKKNKNNNATFIEIIRFDSVKMI